MPSSTDISGIGEVAGGVSVSVALDPAQLARLEAELAEISGGLPRVLTRAVNKVGVAVRTRVVRRVIEQVNLKSRDVRERNVSLTKANFSTLAARVYISGRRVPIYRWAGKPPVGRRPKVGVAYRIQRAEGRKRITDSFVAIMPETGHVGVFVRSSEPEPRMRHRRGRTGDPRPRLHITEQFGPSVPAVVGGLPEFAAGAMERAVQDDLAREVDTQLGLALTRRGGFGQASGEE